MSSGTGPAGPPLLVMSPPMVQVALLSDRGRVRSHNEDACLAVPECGLFAVADGMGGRPGGALAARLVVSLLPGLLVEALEQSGMATREHNPSWAAALGDAVRDLHAEVLRRAIMYPALKGLGATLVSLLLQGSTAHLVHLGDSRAYLQRGGRLMRLTLDQTVGRWLAEGGAMSFEEAQHHPARHQLVRFAGQEQALPPEQRAIPLVSGDRLLLCSDGLTRMVPDARIAHLLGHANQPSAACRALVTEANRAGGIDNVSVIVVDVSQPARDHHAARWSDWLDRFGWVYLASLVSRL